MDVELTPDQRAFARQAIAKGRIRSEEDAVKEALWLWEERERRRLELHLSIEAAEASCARGEYRVIRTEEDSRKLVEDVRRRGMARLAAENK